MQTAADTIRHLTDSDFGPVIRDSAVPVLVDFWSPWCMPCRMLGAILDDVADRYAGRVQICKVNVQECPQAARQLGVSAVPTLAVFSQGRLVDTVVGMRSPAEMEALLDRIAALGD